jgi:hypothetical protein
VEDLAESMSLRHRLAEVGSRRDRRMVDRGMVRRIERRGLRLELGSRLEGSQREDSQKEGSLKEGSLKEGSLKEGSLKEGSHLEHRMVLEGHLDRCHAVLVGLAGQERLLLVELLLVLQDRLGHLVGWMAVLLLLEDAEILLLEQVAHIGQVQVVRIVLEVAVRIVLEEVVRTLQGLVLLEPRVQTVRTELASELELQRQAEG